MERSGTIGAERGAVVTKKCSIMDSVFFANFSRLFNIGAKRPLTEADLFPLPKAVQCANLVDEFDNLILMHGLSFGKNLFRLVKLPMALAILLKIIEQVLAVTTPFIMAYFLKEIKKDKEDWDYRIIYTTIGLAVLNTLMKSIIKEHALKYTCQVMSKCG